MFNVSESVGTRCDPGFACTVWCCSWLLVFSVGFQVRGLGFRVSGLGFRV